MKNVLIYGLYDLDNLGDDYMMHQIDKKLRKNNINPIYLKVKHPRNYFKTDNYDSIELFYGKNKFKKMINYFKDFFNRNKFSDIDSLICMGGGYTSEDYGVKNILKIYLLFKLFKFKGKKIYFTGQTVGPYKTWYFKILLKKIYKSADKIFVREETSHQLLNSFNIENDLVGDDAYLTVENSSNNENLNSNKEDYIIYNYKDFKGYEQYKEKYFNFLLDIALKTKYKVKIVPFRSDKEHKEYKINYELYQYLRDNNIDVEFVVERNINKFQEMFKNSKSVIGTAYHSIVLGLIFNSVPYSAYCGEYYKIKIKGILKWYTYNDKNCIDISNIDNIENKIDLKFFEKNLEKQKEITNNIAKNVSNAWNSIISEI